MNSFSSNSASNTSLAPLTAPLTLQDCKLERTDAYNLLSGSVDGIELYFKSGPEQDLVYSAEPFIAAMLLPAMMRGRDIRIPAELAVSAKFLANIAKLQSIFLLWYPTLKKIAVDATPGATSADNGQTGCAMFF